MSLTKDIALLAGLLLIAFGGVAAVAQADIPGTGFFDNPIDTITNDPSGASAYDLTTQISVGSTAFGDVYMKSFTYQTQKSCSFCLSIGDAGSLAIGGANNVKTDITVSNVETGKTVYSGTKFIGEIGAGQSKSVDIKVDNLRAGDYRVSYRTVFDPSVYDLTSDGEISKAFTVTVPKQSGGGA